MEAEVGEPFGFRYFEFEMPKGYLDGELLLGFAGILLGLWSPTVIQPGLEAEKLTAYTCHGEDALFQGHCDEGEGLGQKLDMVCWKDGRSRNKGKRGLAKRGRRTIRRVYSHGSDERKYFKKQGVAKSHRKVKKDKARSVSGIY